MKNEILKVLRKSKGEYISGEELSNMFKVSRTAVWKCINQLKLQGYEIDSQTNKGYRLVESPDRLTAAELEPILDTKYIGRRVHYYECIDSTNLQAKKLAEAVFEEGAVVVADEQTAGRGRLGRSWVSPKGKGIWMTVMLKPKINPVDASKVTIIAALAVCKAINSVTGLKAAIKWPNDIVVDGKKLCGILTEMGAELDVINYLIIGIGINANIDKEEFPEELGSIATSIKAVHGKHIERKALAAEIMNNLERYYEIYKRSGSIAQFIPEYKSSLALLDREVRVIYRNEELTGRAVDISRDGHLMVLLQDGTLKEIISGEVSVRGLLGYI